MVRDLSCVDRHHAEAVSGRQVHGVSILPTTNVADSISILPTTTSCARCFGEIVDVGTSEVELIVPLAEGSLDDLNCSCPTVVNTGGSVVGNARLGVCNVEF